MTGDRFVIRPEDEQRGWAVLRNCRARVQQYIQTLHPAGHAVEVIVRKFKKKRSLAQNGLFHLWMGEVAKHYAEHFDDWKSPEVWKEFFKREFLGEKAHEMPGGRVVSTTRGTSDLTVVEFAEFLDRIDQWCSENLQLALPHPMDMYAEAMGKEA